MALFGAQLVFSMVMASLLQKIMPYYSVGRWLLCRWLVRYLHPTDEELRTIAGVPQTTKKLRNRRNNRDGADKGQKNEPFTVPKNLDIQLDPAPVSPIDVIQLHFYSEYQWLIDFSVCASMLYVITEVYYAMFQPKGEFNLSMLWCILVILFCVKILYSMTATYFRTEDGAERIMCFVFGFFFLVTAMGILLVDESILEFNLEPAYANFSSQSEEFLRNQGMNSSGPASLNTFKISLAIASSIIGAFLTFPGLRYARMHTGALRYASPVMKVLLYINFLLPPLVVLCWCKPIMRDYITGRRANRALMTDDVFETCRLWLIVLTCALRLALAPTHFQAYLNMAQERIESMKKESGRVSNIDLQRIIARIFYYLSAAALQYITPAIFILFFTFLMKSLSNLTWVNFVDISLSVRNTTAANKTISHMPESIAETAAQFSLALSNLGKVFTPIVFRGLLSYLTWWICAAWSITSIFGVMYYTYFIQ